MQYQLLTALVKIYKLVVCDDVTHNIYFPEQSDLVQQHANKVLQLYPGFTSKGIYPAPIFYDVAAERVQNIDLHGNKIILCSSCHCFVSKGS